MFLIVLFCVSFSMELLDSGTRELTQREKHYGNNVFVFIIKFVLNLVEAEKRIGKVFALFPSSPMFSQPKVGQSKSQNKANKHIWF